MNDRDLLAIAEAMNERLWRIALDCHDPDRHVFVTMTRPMRRMLREDHGVWFMQILVRDQPHVCIGACAVTIGIQEDGTVRAYHPDSTGVFVTRAVLSVLVRFDRAMDGALSTALSKEDSESKETAEMIIEYEKDSRCLL